MTTTLADATTGAQHATSATTRRLARLAGLLYLVVLVTGAPPELLVRVPIAAELALDNHRRLEHRGGRNEPRRIPLDFSRQCRGVAFTEQDRDEGGSIDQHQRGSPRSS